MGFWSNLFGSIFGKKKKGLGEEDGQARYFKEDFDTNPKKDKKKKTDNSSNASSTENDNVVSENKKPLKNKEKKPKKENNPAPEVQETSEIGDDSPEVRGAVAVSESRATANGKFDIRKAKDGRYFFSLYASNHTVIAYSQIYSSVSAVNTGINSVISNASKADIEDTTLKKPISLTCPKWEIYIDRAGEYRFRLYASNGLCVCHSSHGYTSKSGCKGGIESIRRFAADAKVDRSYLK